MKILLALGLCLASISASADGTLGVTNGTTTLGAGPVAANSQVTNSWSTNLVINTVSETSLFNVIVLANALGTNSDLWVHVGGYYTNNSGTSPSLSFQIKYGSTTIYSGSVGGNVTPSANARPLWIDLHFQNTGSTGQQFLSGYIAIGSTAATTGLGVGTGINGLFIAYPIGGFCAVDSTTQQTFDVRVTHGSQSLSIGCASVASFARIQ